MSNVISNIALGLSCAVFFVTAGCEGNPNFVNSGPSNVTLTSDRSYIWMTGSVRLTATASDADGDSLIYTWSATAGSFTSPSASGASITWVAPNDPGSATITMRVTDEIETVAKSIDVIIGMALPNPITTVTLRDLGYVYIVKGTVPAQILNGSAVTIEQGVVIVFDSGTSGLAVSGALVTRGAPGNPVEFIGNTLSGGSGLWNGIQADGIGSRVDLENTNVANSTDGIQGNDEAEITLEGCTIYDNSSYGIGVTDQAVLTMHNVHVTGNGVGVYIRNSNAALSRSSINDNGDTGIMISATAGAAEVSIDSCSITSNSGSEILLVNGASPRIHYCSIIDTEPLANTYSVQLLSYASADTVHAENNFWGVGMNTAQKIGGVIYDKTDNPGTIMAYVGFEPWLSSAPAKTGAR